MRNVFTYIFALLSANFLLAQDNSNTAKPDSNFHLYLLMGQSNMAGRGEVTEAYKNKNHAAVFMLTKNNEWVPAHHPLHFDKSIAGVGPGLSFGIKMANKNPGIKIGLIPCAVGGTSIDAWQPGGYDAATNTHPYDDAEVRIKSAMKQGVLKGMLWHQGESDSKPEAAAQYLLKLKVLIQRIRSMSTNPQLPVVVGELGRYKEQYQNINVQLNRLPSIIVYTAVTSSQGLKDKGDTTHFDSASAEDLGERFAERLILLQNSISSNKKRKTSSYKKVRR